MFKTRPGLATGCLLFSLNAFSLNANAQAICNSAASDSDGDGWGWENDATCIVLSETPSDTVTPPDSQPVTAQSSLIALEDGTLLAALPFSNAHLSNAHLTDGYAIVTPPDASATGIIYSRSGDTRWTERASVSVPDFELPDQIEESRSVFAISDKYAVLGIPGYYESNAGSAHIFERVSDSQWVLDTVLDGPSRAFDFFGKSVAISNDTLAIGSNPGGEAFQNGRVSIYSKSNDGWTLDQSIDSDFVTPDRFGNAVLLSENLLVIPHLRDGANADIYLRNANDGQSNTNDWQLHSEISGEIFALDQNTIVAAEPGALRTYIMDENNSLQVSSSIEFINRSITSIGLSEQRLVVAFSNESRLHHYLKSADSSWQFAGEIDGLPSIPVNTDRLFLTVKGISGQSVIISRSAFPENIEPISDIHVLDLPGNETGSVISDNTDSESNPSGTDTIGQTDETTTIEENPGVDESSQSVVGTCIDNDGDGYGWNGIDTCFPNGITPTHDTVSVNGIENTVSDQLPACIDTDGDGYGWDGIQTCLPTAPAEVTADEQTGTVCFDSDGDSYGWTGTQTCRFNQDGSITLL